MGEYRVGEARTVRSTGPGVVRFSDGSRTEMVGGVTGAPGTWVIMVGVVNRRLNRFC